MSVAAAHKGRDAKEIAQQLKDLKEGKEIKPIKNLDEIKAEEREKKLEQKGTENSRKRKSRWGSEYDRVVIPGLPVALTSPDMTPEQQEIYLMQLKIEEISLKLRTGNLGIPMKPEDRSPSPEPLYNTLGVRLNTRELRVRQRLEDERHDLIKIMADRNPDYKPPPDYKLPAHKLTEKVFIPQERFPNINFIGLLIGPRGNTLKRLENETSCKIIIRGKGSIKEGKVRSAPMPGEDEPLHALITAPSEEALAVGVEIVKKIIKEGIDCPDGENELRKMQLRELAELNGTLVAAEITRCKNCGSADHRHWECTEVKNIVGMIICSKCGGAGHLSSDCTFEGEKAVSAEEKAKIDDEYQSLMKELGVNTEEEKMTKVFALPKAMVTDLPWASNPSGSFLTNISPSGNQIPLPLPAPTVQPSMLYQVPPVAAGPYVPPFTTQSSTTEASSSSVHSTAPAEVQHTPPIPPCWPNFYAPYPTAPYMPMVHGIPPPFPRYPGPAVVPPVSSAQAPSTSSATEPTPEIPTSE